MDTEVAEVVELVCTHPERETKQLQVSVQMAAKLRERAERAGWTVTEQPKQ